MTAYDAVVLAGGRSRRMHVPDKTRLVVAGASLLDRTLGALDGAERIIVVGVPRDTVADVVWTRESPPGCGPAAALAAGLAHVTCDVVVAVAGDQPLLDRADVDALVAAVGDEGGSDGVVLVDPAGREQWLCSAWHTAALRAAPLHPDGSLHVALSALDFARLPASAPAIDCDTPDDLRRIEELLT